MSQINGTDLALALKDSEDKDVAELAQQFLLLEAMYGELKQNFMRQTAELIMRRNDKMFRELAEKEDGESSEQ